MPVFIMYPRVGRGGQAGRPEGYPEVRTDVQSCFCNLQQKSLWYLEGRSRLVILRRGVCGGGGGEDGRRRPSLQTWERSAM